METGTKISAIAHVSLIGWALFGGTFQSEPLPMAVQDVSVISAEQFAAMTAQREAPEVPSTPESLEQPPEPVEEVNAPEPTQEEQPRPEPVTPSEPEPEPVPETVEVPPEPEVVEEPPLTLDLVHNRTFELPTAGEFDMRFAVRNLLGEEYEAYQGAFGEERTYESYDRGTTFSISLKKSF